MATITFTVGSNARQYADLPSAWAALPADLVAAGNSYVIELYNDSEFTHSGDLQLIGKNVDANHTITIRPAAGQGWANNANVANNALRYNQANGVAFNLTTSDNPAFSVRQDWVFVEGLQFKCNSTGGYIICTALINGPNSVFRNCIIELADSGPSSFGMHMNSGSFFSSLIVLSGSGSDGVRPYNNTSNILCENITINRLPSLARTTSHFGFLTSAKNTGLVTINNCAVFGAEFYETGYSGVTIANCASDGTITGGTNCLNNITAASVFVDPTLDLRSKAGAPLIDAGKTPSAANTTAPTGNRQQGSSADIGAWEYHSAVVAPSATITNIVVNGTSVTISGTTTGSPTSGTVSIAPAAGVANNSAVAQSNVPVTLGSGTFSVVLNNVKIGAYSATATVSTASYPNVPATNSFGGFNVTDGITATVTQDPVDGQYLTVHGTYTGSPTAGTLRVPAAATNPNGATDAVVNFTPSTGAYTATATLVPGNYDAGILMLSDANGTTLPFAGTSAVSVLAISGNPQAPMPTSVGQPPAMQGGLSISNITTSSFLANWNAATDDVSVAGYEYSLDGANFIDHGTPTSVNVTGLTGQNQTFYVRAYDGDGNRSAAISTPVTLVAPITAPGAPTNVTATPHDGHVTVSFNAPASNGGSSITGYIVTASTGQTANGTASPIDITVPNGVQVSFTVHAYNNVGPGPESSSSNAVTPTVAATVPDAPINVHATASDGTASVSFTPPLNNGGSTILSYNVIASTGQTASGTSSPILIAVPNGVAVTFVVETVNAVGPSQPSASSNSVTPNPPSVVYTVGISPASVSVQLGQTQQFTTTVYGTGTVDQRVTLSVDLGSIDQNGLYTAPIQLNSPTATATITATSVLDNTKTVQATVVIVPEVSSRLRNYSGNVRNSKGIAIEGAEVLVFNQDTGVAAQLWRDSGKTLSKFNPIRTDADGYFEFFVDAVQCGYNVTGFGIAPYTRNNIFDIGTIFDLTPLQNAVNNLQETAVTTTVLNQAVAQRASVADLQSVQAQVQTLGAVIVKSISIDGYVASGNGSKASPWIGWDSAPWADNTEFTFSEGYYGYTDSPNFAHNGLRLVGKPGTVLLHSGTGYAFTADAGVNSGSVKGVSVKMNIESNQNAAGGVLARGCYLSDFDIGFRNVPNVCFTEYSCSMNKYRLVRSTADDNQTINPVSLLQSNRRVSGIQCSANKYSMIAEGCTGYAVDLQDCSDCEFEGVLQLNFGGMNLTSTCSNNHARGLFMTNQSALDIQCAGSYNVFNFSRSGGSCSFGGHNNTIIGGVYDTVLNPGVNNAYISSNYSSNGGSFTEAGSGTTKWNLYNVNTGVYDKEQLQTIYNLVASGTTTLGSDTMNIGNGQVYKTPQGLVGIGTMTLVNDAPLQVTNQNNTTTAEGFRMNLGSSSFVTTAKHINCNTGGGDVFIVLGNGNVQNQNNSYGALSDQRLKANVADASNKLDDLLRVHVVNYNMIGYSEKLLGVIAQELEQVFPGMVDTGTGVGPNGETITDLKSVKYSVFVPIIIKAIQELCAKLAAKGII